jgi:hypothetical protein
MRFLVSGIYLEDEPGRDSGCGRGSFFATRRSALGSRKKNYKVRRIGKRPTVGYGTSAAYYSKVERFRSISNDNVRTLDSVFRVAFCISMNQR